MVPIRCKLRIPPTVRGYASPAESSHQVSNLGKPKTAARSKLPTQPTKSRKAESPGSEAQSKAAQDNPGQAGPSQDGIFTRFFHHPHYRYYRRAILVAPAVCLAWIHRPYDILPVNGPSMSPFLNAVSSDELPTKDRILFQRWHGSQSGERPKSQRIEQPVNEDMTRFQRGQIVVYATPHESHKVAVKRVVALPGDIVRPLPGYHGDDDQVVVPWNHIWVEGDIGARSKSIDSNFFGPISQNLVLGEVKAVSTSWWSWKWVDWTQHSWPAQREGRVIRDAIMEAAIDPDAIEYSSGWSNGSIALVLERIKKQPDQVLYAFVTDPKTRQETRRLYNNALYVASVAGSGQEKILATELSKEMEAVYGREALVYGIRMRNKPRDRGELPSNGDSSFDADTSKDKSATDAEKWLRKQGWEIERNPNGTVKTNVMKE